MVTVICATSFLALVVAGRVFCALVQVLFRRENGGGRMRVSRVAIVRARVAIVRVCSCACVSHVPRSVCASVCVCVSPCPKRPCCHTCACEYASPRAPNPFPSPIPPTAQLSGPWSAALAHSAADICIATVLWDWYWIQPLQGPID